MSAIEQFTYTASPWGNSDPGWMTFQKSKTIEDTEIGKLSSYYRYVRPDDWDGAPEADALSSYPVQFVFAKPDSFGGDAFLIQTTFTGKRWYDPRPGDWFVHGFKIPNAVWTKEIDSSVSLFRFFKSPLIQREYPQDLRKKANLISQRQIPWEAPPDLPSLDSLDELEPNLDYDFEAILGRIPDGAWPKLGALLAAAIERCNGGGKAFVFDATRPESLDTMAALLALMPAKLRMEAQFSTYFHAENVREIKADDTFLFYGTVREDESSDPDTGLYGDLPQGGPDFQSRDDVELFKLMVDAGGAELKAKDFDNLVLCWEVASGRKTDVASLREAVKFAERFKGLKEKVANGFAGALADYNSHELPRKLRLAAIVADFELGIDGAGIPGELNDFVRDGALFADALRTLGSDEARKSFADAVANEAESNGSTAELAAMWLGCGQDVRALLMRNVTGPFVSIAALANRYDNIRRDVTAWRVEPGQAAALLAEADKAAEKFGDDFNDMEVTRNSLRYLVALDALKDVDGLSDFERAIRSLGIDEETIRNDVLERVNPGDIPVGRLAETMDAFEVIGMTRADVLLEAIKSAKERGYKTGREEGERSGRHLAQKAEARAEDAEAHRGIRMGLAAVIAVATLLVGLAGGWFLHALAGGGIGEAPSTPPGASRPPPHRGGQTWEEDASRHPVSKGGQTWEEGASRSPVSEGGQTWEEGAPGTSRSERGQIWEEGASGQSTLEIGQEWGSGVQSQNTSEEGEQMDDTSPREKESPVGSGEATDSSDHLEFVPRSGVGQKSEAQKPETQNQALSEEGQD